MATDTASSFHSTALTRKGGTSTVRLLRKPRVPNIAPKPPPSPPPGPQLFPDIDPEFFIDNELMSPGYAGPMAPSPPPPSEQPGVVGYQPRFGHGSVMSEPPPTTLPAPRSRYGKRTESRFMLDPLFRDKTQLGTYVEGQSLIKPYRPRGPPPLPPRQPKTQRQIMDVFLDDELQERYYEIPQFTLRDFLVEVAQRENVPLEKVKQVVMSKHNYVKLQNMLAKKFIHPQQKELTIVQMVPPPNMPHVTPRVPQKQLLIEMAALIKEQMSHMMNTDMKPLIKSLPKYSPDYKPGQPNPHTEILLYEDDSDVRSLRAKDLRKSSEVPGKEDLFHSSTSRYFQGGRRSGSPFTVPDEDVISPAELAVLDSLMNGGKALSLKANFITTLPDISPLSKTITYLNLSFNDIRIFPYEVVELEQLTILKLRNNPLRELHAEIGKLKNLRTLVFSFCLVHTLPMSIFSLKKLEHLDFCFNRVSFIPNEIKKLKNLRELNVEGNQLPAMPVGCLRLTRLKYLKVTNNYMHPLFWKENSAAVPQRLSDIAALTMKQLDLMKLYPDMPENVKKILDSASKCDCCRGPRFGPGLRSIRPVPLVFGIKNLPVLFLSCSSHCLNNFSKSRENLVEMLYGVPSEDSVTH